VLEKPKAIMIFEHTSAQQRALKPQRLSRGMRRGLWVSGLLLAGALWVGLLSSGLSGAPRMIAVARAAPAKKAEKVPRPQVTFTGFHVFADGSSRIWVRLTKAVNVEEHASKGKVIFVLKGAKVPGRNNKNPLITSHFASSVMSARLLATKHDAELVINLKQDVAPKHRVVSRPDGTTSVQIDFPAPSAAPGPAPSAAEVEK
jgi:hypothetical protein